MKDSLEHEYQLNPRWDYQKKVELAIKLHLTLCQVGKWNWDRRKKDGFGKEDKSKSKAISKQSKK